MHNHGDDHPRQIQGYGWKGVHGEKHHLYQGRAEEKGKRQSDSLSTLNFITKLRRKVKENPTKSTVKLAEEMRVQKTNIKL